MTTALNTSVVIEATGLVRVCAWCVPVARLAELHRQHRCTDTLCPSCADLFAQRVA